jgi:hypothetical protein
MKLSIFGFLMLIASAANAQGIPGCQPAAVAALELKSIADERGHDAALDAWHSMRVMQDLPVWHEIPLGNLMEASLQEMSAAEIRGTVLVACTLTFSEFASETAKQLLKDLKNPPATASASLHKAPASR